MLLGVFVGAEFFLELALFVEFGFGLVDVAGATVADVDLLAVGVWVELFEFGEVPRSKPRPRSVAPSCGGVMESTAPIPPTVPAAISRKRFIYISALLFGVESKCFVMESILWNT